MNSDQALLIIRSGRVLEGVTVGPILLMPDSGPREIRHPITFRRCHVEELDATMCEFYESVVLTETVFSRAGFLASYFHGGLLIQGCHFKSRVNFECGGHNAAGKTILVQDTLFEGFVNFFDCLFKGPVILRNVEFREGTNLCGFKGGPTEPSFEAGLTLENVSGTLDLNEELT